MNLGDGLLFELENGKPKLILLSGGAGKTKLPCRPRQAKILSSRQLSSVEPQQGDERFSRLSLGRQRETRTKSRQAAPDLASSTVGWSSALTHKAGNAKKLTKGKPDRLKHTNGAASPRCNGTTDDKSGARGGSKRELQELPASGDVVLKDSVVSLAQEQLQQILNIVETNRNGPKEDEGEHQEGQGDGDGEDRKEEETKAGGSDPSVSLQDTRFPGVLFSWLDERQSESRDAVDARKARWRRELDEQVALKQQCLVPSRAQVEEDAASLLSVQSSIRNRDVPAAIKSSLKIGEVTPMEEVVSVKKKEEQRRRWLEELDKQREETSERRRREKLLESQAEDHELWVSHFDSLQRRPPSQFAAPLAPPHHRHHHHLHPPPLPPPSGPCCLSDRAEWEPSSSLSLAWEGLSSCGADSVCGASVAEAACRNPTRSSYLRSMTALLDPSQLEERERRRLKQLEQQRAIEAQVEERRRRREQEEARRWDEEEREERRLAAERETMRRRHEEDLTLRSSEKEQLGGRASRAHQGGGDPARGEEAEQKDAQGDESAEADGPSVTHKDTAVQTEAATPPAGDRDQTPAAPAQQQPGPLSRRTRALRTGKENICQPGRPGRCSAGGDGGGDPYEAFARTERSKRDKKRPEWNTQRPSRQFVPASERYPAPLQRNRQESRLKRQAELLALQERARPPRSAAPQQQPDVGQSRGSPGRTAEEVSIRQSRSAASGTERGRSPPVPALRHRVHSLQAPPTAPTQPPPPAPQLPVDFIPYTRTDEVLNQDPLDPADVPPPLKHTSQSHVLPEASPHSPAAPPAAQHRDRLLHPELPRNSHAHRQQEILRGLAQLRQGLLQKQRELEMDLNPLLKPCANNELQ